MKPGKNDVKLSILIAGDELQELQRFTWEMSEAFGLDGRIDAYAGKRPIGFYSWDVECLLAVTDSALKNTREYPDKTSASYAAMKRLDARLKEGYKRVWG